MNNDSKTATYVAKTLHMTAGDSTYDTHAKALLSDRQVLSWILKYTVREFHDMNIPDIMGCIDDDITVDGVPIDPGLSSLGPVRESKTEDAVPGEGVIFFDIRFSAYSRTANVKFLMDLEAQNDSRPGRLRYHLENRIVFYLSRMISGQKNREFFHSNYNSLRNVRSIWVCMDGKRDGDSIEEISLIKKTVFGAGGGPSIIGLMQGIIITIRIRENVEPSECALISMLETLFSSKSVKDKKDVLEREYGIVMTVEMERRLNTMCNISELFIEEGLRKGMEQGLEQGLEQGELNRGRQDILDLLEELGDIPQDIYARIHTQNNMEALRQWLKSAAKAVSFDAFREKMG